MRKYHASIRINKNECYFHMYSFYILYYLVITDLKTKLNKA